MGTKSIVHTKKSCGGIYEILYKENVPYLKCENCGHEIDDWIKWDAEYKNWWRDSEKWNEKKNHLTCILGYILARFENHYGMPFALSLNEKGLFRGPEINVLRKIYASLGSDAWTVKRYVDWYWDQKIERRKKKITSISFLATPQLLNEFSFYRQKANKVTRDKKLPSAMINWINENAKGLYDYASLEDWGDLKMLMTHYKNGHLSQIDDANALVSKLREQNIISESNDILNWSEE